MHIILFATAAAFTVAAAQGSQGSVTGITAKPTPIEGGFYLTIQGSNPCASVHMDFGDGTSHTYAVRPLPDSETIWHHYTRGGTFTIRATGADGCRGQASVRVSVNLPAAEPPPPPVTRPAEPPRRPDAAAARFPGMDRNGDGMITRAEWQGSQGSFRFHDWNNDGTLAGDEVRLGVTPPARPAGRRASPGVDWSEPEFRELDRNRDGQISRGEWRYDVEDFVRVDRDGNNALTREEFLISQIDDDRGDRFADLDVNGDNRVDRNEWHGSEETFRWLDRNANGWLSVGEVQGVAAGRGRGAPTNEPVGTASGIASNSVHSVSARQPWTDTGIDLRPGDVLTVTATGQIQWATDRNAVSPPEGGNGPGAPSAPVPGAGIGALVARIGDGRPFVAVGGDGIIRVQQAGRLFLGTNDDLLTDNSGAFRATVTVRR